MGYKDVETRRNCQRRLMREHRAFRREHHLCERCKEIDAYTLAGHRYCRECRDKENARNRDRYAREPGLREKKNAESRERRAERKEAHLCTTCGKPLPAVAYPYATCEACRAAARNRSERERRELGIYPKWMNDEFGLCVRCGAPRMEGETAWRGTEIKLCARCYADSVNAAARGREAHVEKYGKTWGQTISCGKGWIYEQRKRGGGIPVGEAGETSA